MHILFKSLILGIIQGLAEFLPISSSGHLAILHKAVKFDTGSNLFFDVILHLGTLFAIFVYFRKDIFGILISLKKVFAKWRNGSNLKSQYENDKDFRLFTFIFFGSIPTAVIGIIFKDYFEDFAKNITYVGIALLFTAFMLLLFELKKKATKTITKMTILDSFIIGTIQGIAIIPGISRSGSTISTAKILGIDKEVAARYSFLLSIPAVGGAFLLELKDALSSGIQIDFLTVTIGFVASFVVGILSLKFLVWLIKKASLKIFVAYCSIIGILAIYASIANLI